MNEKQKNWTIFIIALITMLFLILAFSFSPQRYHSGDYDTEYAIDISYFNGYIDYQKWNLDQDSINNLTGSTIELEVSFPNESIRDVYPFSLAGQFYIPQSPYNKSSYQHTLSNLEINKSYFVQFHFVLYSKDPDIQKLILIGEDNHINGTAMIPKNGYGLTFASMGSTYNFSYEIWNSNYYLWFCKSLQFKLTLYH